MQSSTLPQSPPALGVRAELDAVQQDYPGWRCWTSDAGRVNAVHVFSRAELAAIKAWLPRSDQGLPLVSGVTLDAATPAQIRYEIARHLDHAHRGWAA